MTTPTYDHHPNRHADRTTTDTPTRTPYHQQRWRYPGRIELSYLLPRGIGTLFGLIGIIMFVVYSHT